MGRTPLLFILAAGAAFASEAEGDKPKAKAEASATVTVTAEATPVEVSKTPNPVVVLDADTIRRSGAANLADLLDRIFPGQALANGGPGTSSSFKLGGARDQDVVVLVDGVRVQDAAGLGTANLSALSLAGIVRVEVQKGPSSTRFGAQAMGGVVALYTAEGAAKGLSGEVAGSLGTRGHRSTLVSPSYGWGSGWVRLSLEGGEEDQSTETKNPFRMNTAYIAVGQTLGEATQATLSYRNAYFATPIPYQSVSLGNGSRPDSAYVDDREVHNRNEQVTATLRTVFSPALSGEFILGQALQDRFEWNDFVPGRFEPYNSRRNQATANLQWTPAETYGLALTADAYEEFAAISTYDGTGDKTRGEGRHLALGLEGHLEPLAWLRLTGSVRQQWDRQNFLFSSGPVLPDVKMDQASYRVGANAAFEQVRVYAAVGTGFGLPFLSAVMYNQSIGVNPANGFEALQSEKSRFVQVGGDWHRGNWVARIEASRTRYDRLVYFDPNGGVFVPGPFPYFTGAYVNGADMRVQGAEAAFGYRSEPWGVEGFYRNQEARDLKTPEGQQLQSPAVVRRPFQSLGLIGHILAGPVRFDAHWSWFGPRYEFFGGYPGTYGASKTHFNDLGLAATWKASEAFSLGLRGEHLMQPRWTKADWLARSRDFQNDASQIYGFPAQGPILSLELRYRF